MPALTALAPAKINLFLHVGAVDADGYHPLSSLIAFADVGDRVSVEPADRLSLTVAGPRHRRSTIMPLVGSAMARRLSPMSE